MNQIFIVASAFVAGALVDAIVHRVFILSRLNTKIRNLNLACQERQTQLQLANDDIRRYQLRLLELSGGRERFGRMPGRSGSRVECAPG